MQPDPKIDREKVEDERARPVDDFCDPAPAVAGAVRKEAPMSDKPLTPEEMVAEYIAAIEETRRKTDNRITRAWVEGEARSILVQRICAAALAPAVPIAPEPSVIDAVLAVHHGLVTVPRAKWEALIQLHEAAKEAETAHCHDDDDIEEDSCDLARALAALDAVRAERKEFLDE